MKKKSPIHLNSPAFQNATRYGQNGTLQRLQVSTDSMVMARTSNIHQKDICAILIHFQFRIFLGYFEKLHIYLVAILIPDVRDATPNLSHQHLPPAPGASLAWALA